MHVAIHCTHGISVGAGTGERFNLLRDSGTDSCTDHELLKIKKQRSYLWSHEELLYVNIITF